VEGLLLLVTLTANASARGAPARAAGAGLVGGRAGGDDEGLVLHE
jgi:hypothetical protein